MNTNLSIGEIATMNGGEVPDTIVRKDPNAPLATTDTTTDDEDAALIAEVDAFYATARSDRRPYEVQWFVNAALIRGLHASKFNPITNQLETSPVPTHRSNDALNLVLPKVKAKLSKMLKSRAIPVVTPASTDYEDVLNAKGSTKALEYQWQRLSLEQKYEEVVLLSMVFGKAFWWIYWDAKATGQVREDQIIGKPMVHDIELGDVGVEVDDAFGLLVGDMGIMRLNDQPKIMRVKARHVADAEKLWEVEPGTLTAEVKESELFQYQRQIAALGARATTGYGMRGAMKGDEQATHTIVKELFEAPCAKYPEGRYIVVASGKVLHKAQFLPFDLGSSSFPYPAVEFCDTLSPGQFWPTTMVEQLSTPQKRYNRMMNQLDEEVKLHTHPWIFVPKQAQVHQDAFGSEAGQKIPYNFQPGMPPPEQWIVRPGNVNQDIYRIIDMTMQHFDIMSNLYPAAIGAAGATSGFDTNLLQEAADSVHAPDIRRNELALRQAAFIIRRIMKMGWDIPRLITVMGRDNAPEAMEFYNEQIDEHANIVIDTGSALSDMKAARLEQILKLDERQAFGPPGDPQRNRKLLRLLDMGSYGEQTDLIGQAEEHARLENLAFIRDAMVEDPMPWEDHDVEYEIHTNLLQSPQIQSWPPVQRAKLVAHVILHTAWKNPQHALMLAMVFQMQDVIAKIQNIQQIQAMAMAPQGPPQQAPQGQPSGAEAQAQPAPQPQPQQAPPQA
jgi:hypothetical protein